MVVLSMEHNNPLIGLNFKKKKKCNRLFWVFHGDLITLDLGFGFPAKNSVYSRLETSGTPQCCQNITKFNFGNALF